MWSAGRPGRAAQVSPPPFPFPKFLLVLLVPMSDVASLVAAVEVCVCKRGCSSRGMCLQTRFTILQHMYHVWVCDMYTGM